MTLVALLSACAETGALDGGTMYPWVHEEEPPQADFSLDDGPH